MNIPYLEIVIFSFFAYYFYSKEKPKIYYFLLGLAFVSVSLILQLPLKLLEPYLKDNFTSELLPILLITIGIPIIMEIIKYFSLKRVLKTKSYKNGIFFGIAWVGMISIPYFAFHLYNFVFSYFNLMYEPTHFIQTTLPLWSFIFFFVINLAITVLVIFSVIKNSKLYLLYALLYTALIHYTLHISEGDIVLQIIFFLFSLFVIFKYKMIG